MIKKSTSLLWMLAVMLFALPLQAQDIVTKQGPSKVLKAHQPSTVVKKVDAPQSKEYVPEGILFRQAGSTPSTTFTASKAPQAKEPKARTSNTKILNAKALNVNALNAGKSNRRTSVRQMSFSKIASPKLVFNATGEEKDENGIIVTPGDGVRKVYDRSGKVIVYDSQSQQYVISDQNGTIHIVECEDGTIYIKDIVNSASTGAWVKGTKSGNTITVPARQPVYFSSQYNATVSLRWGKLQNGEYLPNDGFSDHFTFTIDGNVIKLEGTSNELFMGLFWDDDDYFVGGDYDTQWTYSHDYEELQIVTITPPADLVTETWTAQGHQYVDQAEQFFRSSLTVGFDGNDVYIKGMFEDFPNAWMKGTIEGNTITFKDLQYQGLYYDTYDIYAVGTNGNDLQDFIMTYDAENKVMKSNNELVANAATDRIYYLSWYTDLTIMHDYEAPVPVTITPPEGLVTETWYTTGHKVVEQAEQSFKGTITLGFEGTDVYIKGMFSDFPNSWMKGTIEDSTVTFSGFQYQGVIYDQYDIYAIGTDGDILEDFTMTFDAENKVMKSNNQLLANADMDRIYYLQWYTDLTIQLENPSKPIETLPYKNTFDTTEEQEEFTILDVNGDGSTWSYYEGTARYRYDDYNDADDWLFSPLFKLEAGKKYHFSIDIYGKLYPERFEVYLGKNFTGEAMSIEVIPATDVDWNDPKTFSCFVEVPEAGNYAFGIHAISDADMNVMMADNFYLEETNPDAPTAVGDFTVTPGDNVLEATISFTAPTKKNSGEDLTENLTKIEILRDGEVVKTFEDVAPGTELTYTDNDPAITYGKHVYQAVAYNAAGAGEKSKEVEVFLTATLEIPFTADFSTEASFDIFTCIDANEDDYTWEWNDTDHAYYRYNSDEAADDYLISPPLHLEAGKNYDITVNAGSAGYDERFEVLIGKDDTVDGLSTKVFGPVELTNEDDEAYDGVYACKEEGTYYVAIHCISDADQYILMIHKLAIEVGAADEAPAAPALTATAGAEGAMNANIEITAPTKTVGGQDLAENMTKMEIYRDGELLHEVADVAPGAAITYLDETVTDSIHTYYAMAYNAFGHGLKSEKAVVFVGFDVPADVENFMAYDKTNSVLFGWDKVGTIGYYGGYVDPAAVDYSVYGTHYEDTWFGPMLVLDDEPLAVLRDANTYETEYNTEEGDQDLVYWGLIASNEKGESGISAASLLVGKSYDLPVEEGFSDSSLHYYWESNASLMVSDEATDGDGVALMMLAEEPGKAYFNSGKLNLKSASNPTLLFDVAGDGINLVEVTGSVNNEPLEVLSEIAINDKYTTVQVPLTTLKEGGFARVGITANYVSPTTFDWWTGGIEELGDVLLVDNIRIVDLLEHNLSITVSAPSTVVAGKAATIKAVVKNEGEKEASGYIVTFKAGGKELMAQTVDEALASAQTKEFTAELATSIFDEAGNVTIVAEVSYDKDLNTANNTAETVVTVKEPTASAPTNLVAQDKGGEGVDLSWEAPANNTTEKTEDFEDTEVFPTFGIGGITETEHNGAFGDWTLYDSTGAAVYTWSSYSNYENATAPCAWQVFDPIKVGFSADAFPPYSGSQFLMSMCIMPDEISATDHWLISPELPGIAQTIKFQARTITDQYGEETFEVLASTTDNKPESFKKVSNYSIDVTEWTEFTIDLPEGTTYFAIRHTSTDIFGLFVDDITYVAGGGEVASFNIYYDGQLIANVAGDVTTYTVGIDQVTGGEHTFGVSAVYDSGQESKPATATVLVTDGIEAIIADGQPVDIYTIDGKLVRKQAKSLDGLKGVYVVNGKTVMVK